MIDYGLLFEASCFFVGVLLFLRASRVEKDGVYIYPYVMLLALTCARVVAYFIHDLSVPLWLCALQGAFTGSCIEYFFPLRRLGRGKDKQDSDDDKV